MIIMKLGELSCVSQRFCCEILVEIRKFYAGINCSVNKCSRYKNSSLLSRSIAIRHSIIKTNLD